jgi:site-specific recombinase XerC
MPKSRPQTPRPDRRRSIRGSFSWIDHRFLREGFDQGLTRLEKLLYFVLVAVSNQDGVSFYSDARLTELTVAGLRSLFRHHRVRSQVRHANPHRLRHSFGADMVRAGISLPALKRLMGHSQISTTLLYVELAPQDVWREYACAIEKRKTLDSSHLS